MSTSEKDVKKFNAIFRAYLINNVIKMEYENTINKI